MPDPAMCTIDNMSRQVIVFPFLKCNADSTLENQSILFIKRTKKKNNRIISIDLESTLVKLSTLYVKKFLKIELLIQLRVAEIDLRLTEDFSERTKASIVCNSESFSPRCAVNPCMQILKTISKKRPGRKEESK